MCIRDRARIDPAKCKGCSQCVAACPKGIISLVPLKKQAVVRCSSCDKAKGTMAVCNIGCIGCGKCVADGVCILTGKKVPGISGGKGKNL